MYVIFWMEVISFLFPNLFMLFFFVLDSFVSFFCTVFTLATIFLIMIYSNKFAYSSLNLIFVEIWSLFLRFIPDSENLYIHWYVSIKKASGLKYTNKTLHICVFLTSKELYHLLLSFMLIVLFSFLFGEFGVNWSQILLNFVTIILTPDAWEIDVYTPVHC